MYISSFASTSTVSALQKWSSLPSSVLQPHHLVRSTRKFKSSRALRHMLCTNIFCLVYSLATWTVIVRAWDVCTRQCGCAHKKKKKEKKRKRRVISGARVFCTPHWGAPKKKRNRQWRSGHQFRRLIYVSPHKYMSSTIYLLAEQHFCRYAYAARYSIPAGMRMLLGMLIYELIYYAL